MKIDTWEQAYDMIEAVQEFLSRPPESEPVTYTADGFPVLPGPFFIGYTSPRSDAITSNQTTRTCVAALCFTESRKSQE